MGFVILVLSVLLVGIIHVGRIVAAKSDAQRAADAAALSASITLRDFARPSTLWQTVAEGIGNRNTTATMSNWVFLDGEKTLDVSVDISHLVSGLPPFPASDVRTNVTTRIQQQGFWAEDVEWRYPKLALVLDYSGSMTAPFLGGANTKATILKEAVKGLVEAGLRIDFGAVFFSTAILNLVAFDPANSPTVINQIKNRGNIPASGETNVGVAFSRAKSLLAAAEDTGRYVMFVSDGAPCCDPAPALVAAKAAANTLWASNTEIFSVEIQDVPPVSSFSTSMKYMAGAGPGDVSPWYIRLNSAAELLSTFQGITPHSVCRVGPLSPAPRDPGSMKVYLSIAGERPPNAPSQEVVITEVPAGENLVDYSNQLYYIYDEIEQKLYLSESVCTAIVDDGAAAVTRFGQVRFIR